MRSLLCVAVLMSSLAQAAQVTLREGESGQLGGKTLHVLHVEDHRCGPTENCLTDVLAQVEVDDGTKTSTVVVSLVPRPPQPWSGIGVVRLTGDQVTFTNQPQGNSDSAQHVTLRRGATGWLGGRQLTVQGWETVRCLPQVLCVRPEWSYVYVRVTWGSASSWISLEYPRVPEWPGISLTDATAEKNPGLTFTDTQP